MSGWSTDTIRGLEHTHLDTLDLMRSENLGESRVDDNGNLFDSLLSLPVVDTKDSFETLVWVWTITQSFQPFLLLLLGGFFLLSFLSFLDRLSCVYSRIEKNNGVIRHGIVQGARYKDRLTPDAESHVGVWMVDRLSGLGCHGRYGEPKPSDRGFERHALAHDVQKLEQRRWIGESMRSGDECQSS